MSSAPLNPIPLTSAALTPALSTFLKECQTRTDQALEHALSQLTGSEPTLIDAMRYSLLNGGKRIRPTLAYASAMAVGGCARSDVENGDVENNAGNNVKNNSESPPISSAIDHVSCSLECIHAYSLIHDDLPAMDDDDLRRGKPTCHIAFNEATAILAGDALQALAFQSLAESSSLSSDIRLHLVQQLAAASGAQGMVGGQAIDLASVNTALNLQQLQRMHNLKTGALIAASVLMGATATGNATAEQLTALKIYADAIGLAFQVQDDILDVTADTATLGKQQGADMALNKPTYVALLGLEGAQRKAQELHQQALAALSDFDEHANTLRELSAYIVGREK